MSTNEILHEILYNKNIRFAIYGGLYLFLFLFVGTVSFIKTYQNEKAVVLKRKRAFQRKPGEIQSSPAPIELTDTDIQIIQQRKRKKKSLPSPNTFTNYIQENHTHTNNSDNNYNSVSVLTPSSTIQDIEEETKYNNSETHQIHKITIEEYNHNDNKHKNGTTITNGSSISNGASHNKIPLTVNNIIIEDIDNDNDYYGTYSSFHRELSLNDVISGNDSNISLSKNKKTKKQKCFCNDFCYIICRTDFRSNWPKDTWRLRSIYTVIIVYLSDYLTDLNILILWSIAAWQQYTHHKSISDNGLNMIFMAIASAAVLIFYKLISAFAVFKVTGNIWYGLLQFLDLYIFIEVYNSHKKGYKSDRLRWLSNLESVFEASPQIILQLVYLIQTGNTTNTNNNTAIVILGLFFSVIKLGNTAINNDAVHVTKDSNIISQYKFWLRSLFRITEITARQFMFVLMWLIIGEKFLCMVFIINLCHNMFLYYGGCLSKQIWNIAGHVVSLAQLSYTIVEGKPLDFFLRGKLHQNNPDYPNDTRSKLQFPYSIFIVRYLQAKGHQKQRRQADRKMRARNAARQKNNNNKNKNKRKKIATPLTPTISRVSNDENDSTNTNTTMLSVSDEMNDSRTNMMMKPIGNSKTKIFDASISEMQLNDIPNKPPMSFGELHLNDSQIISDESNINDKLNEITKLNEIEKYKTSIGDLDGIYSYFLYIHSIMILYLNIYLSSQRPQQIMMIQRTILGLIWLLIIGIQNGNNNKWWKYNENNNLKLYSSPILLIMYCISILFSILSLIFFYLMMEREVINEVKKKEEIQFKTIYDAIYYGRLDAIINQFDKTSHLTSLSCDGKSALYYACELSQIDIAEWLMNKRVVDINIGANQNRTPLYISCRVGCYEIVRLLLNNNNNKTCDYNRSNELGRTPLYAACREGHTQIVIELLAQPLIDINALTAHSSCALSAACQHGYPDIVEQLLLKPEIEINILNSSSYTPIFIAALGTHCEIVKILLDRAEIEIDKGLKNDETLFYVSCERGMDEIVEILIDREDYHVDINQPNSKHYTPLYIASCFGHASIISILMNIDRTTLNQCDEIGRTPFFVACRKGNASAVFKLLEYDEIDIHAKDQDELTPFAAACQGGSVAVVEKLMKLVDRSEIIGVDRMKRTPFFMACREGQTDVVKRLMREDNIIDINQADKLLRTPLMVCVKRAHEKCLQTLCKNYKIDINQVDHQERSPLFIAAKCGTSHSNVVKSLMTRKDLLINAKAQGGKTALHIACELGHSTIVMLLLDHNDIDVNEPDENGVSPLAIADKKLDNNVYMRMVMISMRD